MKKLKNLSKTFAMLLILMFATSVVIAAFPIAMAQEPERMQTYPFIGVTPNPVGVNQQVLIHLGITCELPGTHYSWEGITVTLTKPDGTSETLGPFSTDSTGGTGSVYTPTMVGTYKLQTHYPEQVIPAALRRYYSEAVPEGTIMVASDSEIIELVVQDESIDFYSGHSLPTEYWTRPIDAQLWEWSAVSESWVSPLGNSEVRKTLYNDGPETAHILWATPLQTGGLAGGEFGAHSYECGAAYEDKASPRIIIAGVFYCNKFESRGGTNVDQEVVAIDLHTGEVLWSQPLVDSEGNAYRLSFGQQFYWDSYNYHGVFGYLWGTSGRTWSAFDAATGRWIYTMENVPSGTTLYGSKGEIYRYSVNTDDAWMTLWNSSRVVSDEGSWRPHGNVYENADELGLEWNITIPTGLPGSAAEVVLGDRVVGLDVSATSVSSWGFSLKAGDEGDLLFSETWTPPADWDEGRVSVASKGVSIDDGVFVVSIAETRQHWGFDLETCDLIWGPTEPQHYLDYYQNMPSWIVDGKLFSGGMSGIAYCYDVSNGDLLWTYEMEDPYNEVTWGVNYPRRYPQGFIADGKYYSGYYEHSPIDPKPRDTPFFCIDVETGEEIWTLSLCAASYRLTALIGDSVLVAFNTYDNRMYGLGKGPTQTNVWIQTDVLPLGSKSLVKGTVTDISPGTEEYALTARFPNGVPAVADSCMSEWMQYVYMQFERPANAIGVPVRIEAIDPNGNYQDYGTTTTDSYGDFGFTFEPEIPGQYMIIATFGGSEAYYGSTSTTYLTVNPATTVSTPIEPEETVTPTEPEEPETETPDTETPDTETPDTEQAAEAPLISTEVAILAAVVVASIIGVASFFALKKRK
ncbi:MAG: hypothetical protein CW691_00740 [Candidatus Bathyarchaeum sp.]|nr:MAG: hypothetical protein CW691_00740 [Candidatus Bathyarchaeum sp.]